MTLTWSSPVTGVIEHKPSLSKKKGYIQFFNSDIVVSKILTTYFTLYQLIQTQRACFYMATTFDITCLLERLERDITSDILYSNFSEKFQTFP